SCLCYRLSRGERSGRYGSDGHRDDDDYHDRRNRDEDRDYDHRWSDERHRDRYDDYSPERGRKRRHSNDSDDEYDMDYPDQDGRMESDEESKTIMLRGLSLHVTEDDIRTALEHLPGPQPVDIRLMKKRTGISRGFAFVEFYHLQDSTRWMETNQNKLVIQGKSIAVHYSNRRQKAENWLCNSCGLYNFRKRQKCFRCGAAQAGDLTIILRNIAPDSSVDGILSLLSPFVNLNAGHIRLIKDKQTGQNRGFAFVQLSSPLEASQLLTMLQGLQPPLKLDGKTIGVDYAKSARKDSALADGIRANALSVASTAIAAAQWSSSQVQTAPGLMPPAAVVPDTSSYQYDESSGYYYDAQTGLYYDPNSQYYYNSETQQYLYWDSEKQIYVPAPGSETNTEETPTTNASNSASTKEPKEKKDKPKSKSAQQIAKDMERWAKTLNRQKENNKNSSGASREEERKESASADAGFYLFEKKRLNHTHHLQNSPENSPGVLVASYSGDSDPEEAAVDEEAKITDWSKKVCLLCRRQFPTKDALLRHQQLSDLHKQNLEIQRRTRLSEAELEELERREAEASLRTKGTGLGVKGSAYELSASDTYKDAVRKAMFARYTELE
uniref:RNA binding motif protein 5 n=1 Tax=Periophthalmus magnuspinnatus TaxID=409849 RepID=A0A3B3ZLV5_9GOBI